MSLGQLVLELKLNGNEFTVGLKSASGQLGQFVAGAQRANTVIQRAERATSSWGHVIRDTVIGLALARDAVRTLSDVTFGWQKAIIAVNSDMQRSIALMKNFSREKDAVVATQEAISDVNKILDRAATSPFNLTQVTDAFVKLRVGGVKPTFQALNTLIDSVAAFGGSGESLKRAGVAIQQMAGKGVVSMEELRQQLGESVPTAINAMADALGTSYSKLVKEISQGKVTSEPAVAAMMRELKLSFDGSAAAMMNTWGGAVSQFETGVKRLAVAFGGLEKDGFNESGYLSTVTKELKSFTEMLSNPDIVQSAREIGKSVGEFMSVLASGTKWIIENRDAIYEWGKALLYLWAAFKGASIIGSVLTTAGAGMQTLAMRMIAMRMQGQGVISTLGSTVAAMSGWGSAAAVAAGGATRIATGSNAAGAAVRILGGVLGVVAGPIGLVTSLAAAGGYAWYEHAKGVRDAEQAILDLNGALTTNAQLQVLLDKRKTMGEDFKEKFDINPALRNYYFETPANYKKRREEEQAKLDKIDEDISKARSSVAENYAGAEAQKTILATNSALGEVSRQFVIDKENFRDVVKAEAVKDGKTMEDATVQSKLNEGFDRIRKEKIDREISLFEAAKADAQKVITSLASGHKDGSLSQDDLVKYKAANKAVTEYNSKISESRDMLDQLANKKTLPEILIDPQKVGPTKTAFDAMTMYVDGLRKSVAGMGAKVEEANPYLAQLDATVESLGGKKLPNFDAVYASGVKLAEQRWAIEKAQKALSASSREYGDGLERIDQIQALVNNKLNKVENLNPWEKASADSMRYEDELNDLILKMDEARQKAISATGDMGAGQLEKLADKAREAEKKVDDVRETIEKLKVTDTGKAMQTASDAIMDALSTQSEKAKREYDRQTAWADEFYAKHKDQLTEDGEAYAQYIGYRSALDEQYARETENGLQQWIRQNKDATEQYKSLWGSAMDKFNDTLVEGLTSGKLEFGDFVQYVLKEILRIQIAKATAALADSASESGWLKGIIAVGSAIAGGMSGAGAVAGTGDVGANIGADLSGGSSVNFPGAASTGGVNFPTEFANGGIMTKYGQLALKEYANGGIANRPQVAIYGEGKTPEAYVPLPDGRTIPVTMKGGAGGGVNMPVNISIVVNKDGTESAEGSDKATMNDMANKIKIVCMEVLLKESRPGGIIDKRK